MVKLNKIYTRTGDGGSAGLVDGSRVSKSSLRMTAIGEVDEANAAIGVAIAALAAGGAVADRLLRIQNDLFDLGADVATPGEIDGALRIVASQVERLEREIDAMNADRSSRSPASSCPADRPPSPRCISPARSSAAPSAPRSRSTRAEPLNPQLLAYLNRLSDHLFVAARFVAAREGGDVLWQPGAKPRRIAANGNI